MTAHPEHHHARNVFGVAARYGTDADLHASKLPHTMRLREDPTTGRPGVTVRFGR